MTFDSERVLDDIGWQLLIELQKDARLSFAELGRQVGLSAPAVAERVRRLEESGMIRGYRADVEPEALGLSLRVFIDLTTTPQRYSQIIDFMQSCDAIRSAHHVTGNVSFRIEALVASIHELEPLLGQLSLYGQTTTSIVLSSPIQKSLISKPDSTA